MRERSESARASTLAISTNVIRMSAAVQASACSPGSADSEYWKMATGRVGSAWLTSVLIAFAVIALVKVYSGDAPEGSIVPSLDWLWPGGLSLSDFVDAILIDIFQDRRLTQLAAGFRSYDQRLGFDLPSAEALDVVLYIVVPVVAVVRVAEILIPSGQQVVDPRQVVLFDELEI